MGGLSPTRVELQRQQKEEKCVRNRHRAVATTFSKYSENVRLANNVSIRLQAEM